MIVYPRITSRTLQVTTVRFPRMVRDASLVLLQNWNNFPEHKNGCGQQGRNALPLALLIQQRQESLQDFWRRLLPTQSDCLLTAHGDEIPLIIPKFEITRNVLLFPLVDCDVSNSLSAPNARHRRLKKVQCGIISTKMIVCLAKGAFVAVLNLHYTLKIQKCDEILLHTIWTTNLMSYKICHGSEDTSHGSVGSIEP